MRVTNKRKHAHQMCPNARKRLLEHMFFDTRLRKNCACVLRVSRSLISDLYCKSNGSVCICSDFKVSVNLVLHAEQYPLPCIEDIFASLAGGKQYSKLDLLQAYH